MKRKGGKIGGKRAIGGSRRAIFIESRRGKIKKGRKKEEMDNGAAIKRGQERLISGEITARALEIDTLPLWKSDDERGVFFAKCHDYVSRTSNVSRIYRWIIIIERRIVSNNCNVSNSELFFVELFPGSLPRFSSTNSSFVFLFISIEINRGENCKLFFYTVENSI